MPSEGRIRVVYIAGFGRSGSTILDNVLGQYPGMFSGGEIQYLWDRGLAQNRLCGCNRPVPECPVWGEVVASAFPQGPPAPERMVAVRESMGPRHVVSARFGSIPPPTVEVREYLDNLRALYLAIAEVTASPVIVDSSKTPVHAWMLDRIQELDVRIVHLIRDPRAVAHSWQKEMVYDSGGDEPMMMTRHTPARSGRLWLTWNLAADAGWGGDRYLRLRYEDFVERPRSSVRDILRMAEIEPSEEPFVSEHEVRLAPNHALAGNPSRFQSGTIEIAAREGWKTKLSASARRTVTAITLPLLSRYGYPLRVG